MAETGYRKKGLLPDIVDQMMQAYNDGPKTKNPKCHAAMEWARQHDWQLISQQWVELFDNLDQEVSPTNSVLEEV